MSWTGLDDGADFIIFYSFTTKPLFYPSPPALIKRRICATETLFTFFIPSFTRRGRGGNLFFYFNRVILTVNNFIDPLEFIV